MIDFNITVRGSVAAAARKGARRIEQAAKQAVRETTIETVALARGHIATRLTQRAAFLITDKDASGKELVYEDGYVRYIHSRWFRGARGGKLGRSGGTNANDILWAHETGVLIKPQRAKSLFIPARGVSGRGPRQALKRELRRDDVRTAFGRKTKLEFIPSRGGATTIVRRTGKQRGEVAAVLVKSVRLPKRLDFGPIRAFAQRTLTQKLEEKLSAGT